MAPLVAYTEIQGIPLTTVETATLPVTVKIPINGAPYPIEHPISLP